MDKKILLFRVKEYLKYKWRAIDEHGIHSPFLFSLYNELMRKEPDNKDLYFAENFRIQLLSSDEVIEKDQLSIALAEEVDNSAMPEQQVQLIYKLIRKFQPNTFIELGTNAGLSSLYFAIALKGKPEAKLYTIERNFQLHDKALVSHAMLRHGFLGLPTFKFIHGSFNVELPKVLEELPTLDFLFIDGDHQGKSLLNYFNLCLPKVSDQSIFVFDDIYWSPDMLEAWNEIIKHPKVRLSINMFHLGIVFFNSSLTKEDYTLKWKEHQSVV